MILLCGIPSEPPLAMVHERLKTLGAEPIVFNQRHVSTVQFEWEVSSGRITGRLELHDQRYRLEDIQSVYTRLMDDQLLPELRNEAPSSRMRRHSRALHDALTDWCEITSARVVNRIGPMGSNFSKPYQAQLIREHGFAVPATLITNDPNLVHEFRRQHGRVIYKSISGIRSIVKILGDDDASRLGDIRWCPVQFQEFVEGMNVRVHTVGAEVFATAVTTEATDYRYAQRVEGREVDLRAIDLPEALAERCVRLSTALGLPFAGIDLKIAADNRVFCFEVNPSPAFSYYEMNTGQPIALALARYLAGMN